MLSNLFTLAKMMFIGGKPLATQLVEIIAEEQRAEEESRPKRTRKKKVPVAQK